MAWPTGVTLRTCSLGPDFGIVSGDDYGCDIVVSVSRPMMTWGATGSAGIGDQDSLSFVPGQEVTFQLPVTDQAGWYIGGLPIDVSDGQQSHVYTLTIKPWIYNSLGRKTFSNATLTLSNLAVPTGDDTLDLDKSVTTPGAQGGTVTIPDLLADLQASVDDYKTELETVAAAPTDAFVAGRIEDPASQTTAALNTAIASSPQGVRADNAVPRTGLYADLTYPHVRAHRGGKFQAPEDTLVAYDLAVALGTPVLTTNVTMLTDGSLLVMHDATIDRTTNGSGTVGQFSGIGVSGLTVDASAWFKGGWADQGKPLFLHEVLDRFGGRVTLVIEPKDLSDATTQAICDLAKAKGLERSIVVSSFQMSNCEVAVAAGIAAVLILPIGNEQTVADVVAAGITGVEFAANASPTNMAPWIAESSIRCGAYGVLQQKTIAALIGYGLDYVTADQPYYVEGYLNGQRHRRGAAPWAIDGRRSYGCSDTYTAFNVELSDSRLTIAGTAGAYRLQPQAGHKSAILMGWACPLPNPANYTLTIPITFDTPDSNTAAAAKVLFGQPDDSIAGSNSDTVSSAGWRARLTQAGTLQLESSTNGSAYTSEGSKATAAVTAGQTVTLTVVVTPTAVTLTRTDTGDSVTTTNHPEIRGPYWHLRNDCPNAGVYSWGAVTVA